MRTVPKTSLATLALLLGTAVCKDRVMSMRNLCKEPVWFGFASGSVRNIHTPVDTKCGGDGDCYPGTKCIQTGPISQCFFINPKSADGNFKLETN